ncbi:MAG: twin-arginine translocation signal domain-containing protein, partial [Planctomycetes bacterium]|nr:twin-arginine translocation signal domain-containing protein [Planctomycetota bacterium]
MNKQNDRFGTEVSRRNFIKASAAVSAATILAPNGQLFAAGSDKIRVGVIGCGGRGTGAAHNMMEADESVEIVAMCDLFPDKVESSLTKLKNNANKSGFSASRIKVTPETTFTGFNG